MNPEFIEHLKGLASLGTILGAVIGGAILAVIAKRTKRTEEQVEGKDSKAPTVRSLVEDLRNQIETLGSLIATFARNDSQTRDALQAINQRLDGLAADLEELRGVPGRVIALELSQKTTIKRVDDVESFLSTRGFASRHTLKAADL